MTQEYSVLQKLPQNGERCLAFGHKTFCCKCDMDEEAQWHDVIFELIFSSYKLKKEIPKDPEESILEYCHYVEHWKVNNEEFPESRVIGVTKWRTEIHE